MIRSFFLIILISCFAEGRLAAQSLAAADSTMPALTPTHSADSSFHTSSPAQPGISWNRFSIAAGSLLGAGVALHIYQANAWWKDNRTAFHVIDDNEYKGNFDKFGHTFGGYYSCFFIDEAFKWSGMDSTQSAALGSALGALWETYIEIEDGFGGSWGFSRGDFRSDLMGATFYFLRSEIKPLQSLKYKWSYFPSVQYLEDRPDIPGQTINFIEDYGGQEYWMSLDVHSVLPDAAKAYWPAWLNLAVGVGGWNLDATYVDASGHLQNDFSKRTIAYYLSLDYDITKIWPESSVGLVNFLRRSLDYWHFPAPAVRVYPEPRLYLLFPFRMSIG